MSDDVIRDYTGKYGSIYKRRRRRKRPRGHWRSLLLVLVIAGIAAFELWSTSDRYPIENYVPRNQKYVVYVNNILDTGKQMASSKIWGTLPESLNLRWVPGRLSSDFMMPEWVQNNVIGPTCCIAGNDLDSFSDEIFVTKMNWIGSLLDDFYWILPRITNDSPKDLDIRKWTTGNKYFTVRGRILIASPSREALVKVLESASDVSASGNIIAQSGTENFRGTIDLSQWKTNPLSAYLSKLSFAVQTTADDFHLKYRAKLNPQWEKKLSILLKKAQPVELIEPPEGLLSISANFGLSVKDVWASLDNVLNEPDTIKPLWEEWETLSPEEQPGLAHMLTIVLGQMGPGFRLSFRGFDLNEILPVPDIVGTFDTRNMSIDNVFNLLPQPSPEIAEWEEFPRYDKAIMRAYMPMISGPSLEPTAEPYGKTLLVTLSRTTADTIVSQPVKEKNLVNKGNLYIKADPNAIANAILEAGEVLVNIDALKEHTKSSYKSLSDKWLKNTNRIKEISLQTHYENNEIVGEMNLKCNVAQ